MVCLRCIAKPPEWLSLRAYKVKYPLDTSPLALALLSLPITTITSPDSGSPPPTPDENAHPKSSTTTSKMAEHKYNFNITMTCGGCSGAVERVLKKTEGELRAIASIQSQLSSPVRLHRQHMTRVQVSRAMTSLSKSRPQKSPPTTASPTTPCWRRSRRRAKR